MSEPRGYDEDVWFTARYHQPPDLRHDGGRKPKGIPPKPADSARSVRAWQPGCDPRLQRCGRAPSICPDCGDPDCAWWNERHD